MVMTEQEKEGYVRALVHERKGYLARGEKDRAAEVDAELRRLGAEAEPVRKTAAKRKAAK